MVIGKTKEEGRTNNEQRRFKVAQEDQQYVRGSDEARKEGTTKAQWRYDSDVRQDE